MGKSERRKWKEGDRVGWQGDRGRVRVWREDREIDRITGFKSRTEREMARDKGKKREREEEHSGLRRRARRAKLKKSTR